MEQRARWAPEPVWTIFGEKISCSSPDSNQAQWLISRLTALTWPALSSGTGRPFSHIPLWSTKGQFFVFTYTGGSAEYHEKPVTRDSDPVPNLPSTLQEQLFHRHCVGLRCLTMHITSQLHRPITSKMGAGSFRAVSWSIQGVSRL